MYVAQRDLETKDGPVRRGQEVRGTEEWPLHILKANINVGFIKWEGDPNADPMKQPRSSVAKSEGSKSTSDQMSCSVCGKSGFKSQRAVSIHAKRVHK